MSCYLGLDYGLRRIGIAASDSAKSLAFALGTHVEGRDGSILTHLGELTADGREGDMAGRVRKFARRLAREFEVEVILWDERFSSAEADRYLGGGRGSSKEERDAVAAQIILQSYLDSRKAQARSRKEQP